MKLTLLEIINHQITTTMKKIILILHASFLFIHSSLHAQWSEVGGPHELATNHFMCGDTCENFQMSLLRN